MGNTYCCGYQDKPGEDLILESNIYISLKMILLENNINIALKFYDQKMPGDKGSYHSSRASE